MPHDQFFPVVATIIPFLLVATTSNTSVLQNIS